MPPTAADIARLEGKVDTILATLNGELAVVTTRVSRLESTVTWVGRTMGASAIGMLFAVWRAAA
jgi:hypothetical protein